LSFESVRQTIRRTGIMAAAQPVALRVRPWQASHLCFEVSGILGDLNVQLGDSVTQFPFTTYYANLGSTGSGFLGNPSLLFFSSAGIDATVSPLATLRAESKRAALDKAVKLRQNAYWAKYGNAAQIASTMMQYYNPNATLPGNLTDPTTKQNMLTWLAQASWIQLTKLTASYTSDNRLDVVKSTTSDISLKTTTFPTSTTAVQWNENTPGSGQSGAQRIAGGGAPWMDVTSVWNGDPTAGAKLTSMEFTDNTHTQTVTNTTGTSEGTQCITNTDYGYRIPWIEAFAQYLRSQVSLMDQQFNAFMSGLSVPNIENVLNNELASIDLDVKRLQIAYLNTLLLSPIDGFVTGIYKNKGDAVRAGEPVIRVEDNSTVLLVGTLKYPGLITTKSTIAAETILFESSSTSATLSGNPVAVRGRPDDQWEVVVQCPNPKKGFGTPLSPAPFTFPLGYRLDYDDTTVTVTP
jgi:hypothetical protein